MIMQGRVKIAAVGLGNRTCKYLRYVEEHRDVAELVAVVDPDLSKADWAKAAFSLPDERCFGSFDELVASGLQMDACIIGTPDLYHHELAVKAMRCGWHVLLEKPMGQTEEQCKDIVDVSAETGKMVTVCYILRYHPYFMKLKELSADSKMGKILSVKHTSLMPALWAELRLHTSCRERSTKSASLRQKFWQTASAMKA